MYRPLLWISLAALLQLSACAETGSSPGATTSTTNVSAKELAGTYVGSETLTGSSFLITVKISADGRISITDTDNYTGRGNLDGASFKIVRQHPYQVFEGTVAGDTVSGITYGNAVFGRGTFSATRK